MSEFHANSSDALLEKATHLLRGATLAEMPPGLVPATVEALANKASAAPPRVVPRRVVARLTGIAATLGVTVASIAILIMHGGPRVAFAQVLDNAKNADSVAFLFSQAPKQDVGQECECLAKGDKVRVKHSSGIVMVTDANTKKRLFLDATNKTAGVFTLTEHAVAEIATGMVEQLRQVRPADAERIGREVIDGKTTDVFRVAGIKLFAIDSRDGEMRIWVDADSMLPWRIELRIGTTRIATLRKLNWNVPIEPSLLSVEFPDGYAEQPEEVFQRQLRPNVEATQSLTAEEAFQKWRQGK